MSDYITQITPEDDDIAEEWIRENGEAELNVSAEKIISRGAWVVAIWAMEYTESDPLESEIRRRVTAALNNVTGVLSAGEHDHEKWWVTGNPEGRSLVAAAAQVIDDYAEQIRTLSKF